jgi:hypothetical protein
LQASIKAISAATATINPPTAKDKKDKKDREESGQELRKARELRRHYAAQPQAQQPSASTDHAAQPDPVVPPVISSDKPFAADSNTLHR